MFSHPRTDYTTTAVWFSKDGKRVIVHFKGHGQAKQWQLPTFTTPPENLDSLARLLTGIAPGETAGFRPLEPDEMLKNSERYRRTFRALKGLPD